MDRDARLVGHPLGWRRICAAGAATFVLGAGTGAWLKWTASTPPPQQQAIMVTVAVSPDPPLPPSTALPTRYKHVAHAEATGACSLATAVTADLAAAFAWRLPKSPVPMRPPAKPRPVDVPLASGSIRDGELALWAEGFGACEPDRARAAGFVHLLNRPLVPQFVASRIPAAEPEPPPPASRPATPAIPTMTLALVDIGLCRLAPAITPRWNPLPESLLPLNVAPSYSLLAAAAAAAPVQAQPVPAMAAEPPGLTLASVLEAAAAQVAAMEKAERQARRAALLPPPSPSSEPASGPETLDLLSGAPDPDIDWDTGPDSGLDRDRPDTTFDEVRNLDHRSPRPLSDRLPIELESAKSIDERKMRFLATVLPLVLHVNEMIETDRRRLQHLADASETGQAPGYQDAAWLARLAERYGMPEVAASTDVDFDGLLRRVDVVPPSLALAQAAEESGWGRSRFARKGNALFGQITLGENGLMPHGGRPGRDYRIRVFDRLLDSVRSYVHNLNTHWAYAGLRASRAAQRAAGRYPDGLALANGLLRYSERGPAYIANVQSIIRGNLLYRLDGAAEPSLWTYLPAGTRG